MIEALQEEAKKRLMGVPCLKEKKALLEDGVSTGHCIPFFFKMLALFFVFSSFLEAAGSFSSFSLNLKILAIAKP